MNRAPFPVIKSINHKPSIAEFYAVESKFKVVEREYNTLMTHIDGTCLGAQSDTKECIKAQELNLQMQAYLVVLADILAQMGPIKSGV